MVVWTWPLHMSWDNCWVWSPGCRPRAARLAQYSNSSAGIRGQSACWRSGGQWQAQQYLWCKWEGPTKVSSEDSGITEWTVGGYHIWIQNMISEVGCLANGMGCLRLNHLIHSSVTPGKNGTTMIPGWWKLYVLCRKTQSSCIIRVFRQLRTQKSAEN